MKTLRFGIEIETVGLSREQLARAIASVVGGTPRFMGREAHVSDAQGRAWRVVPDGSLSGGDCASGEVVSPILTWEDMETLQQVVRALRNAGARADDSCGIHIHVDGSRFDARTLASLTKMIHKQEKLLEHALGVSQRRLDRFCRSIESDFIRRLVSQRPTSTEAMKDAWYGYRNACPTRYDQSRYHGLNLNSFFVRGTIEFRYFNGTLHAGEVKAYVQLVLALAAKALNAKSTSEKRRDFNPATAKYDFRVVLLGLGLIGEEFKTARHHLTKRLAGSAAWKGERRDREPAPAAEQAERLAA